MDDSGNASLARREWFKEVSMPLIGTSLAPGLLCANVDAAEQSNNAAGNDKDLGARVYNIRDFGAKGDGIALDTAAVQAAIDACAGDKGGTVLVPTGNFMVGTLELKSNVTLHLAAQGRLLGSGAAESYKAGNGIPPGNGNIVLISAANADNVTIEGPGTIDGNGAKFFTGRGDNTGPGQNSAEGYYQRPHLLVF